MTAALPDMFEANWSLTIISNLAALAWRNLRLPLPRGLRQVDIDNESDQVSKGYPEDALALRGDEGRSTLR